MGARVLEAAGAACDEIALLLGPSFGPYGCDCMVVSSGNAITMTDSGALLLQQVSVPVGQPIAHYVIGQLVSHDRRWGDGSSRVALLVAAALKELKVIVNKEKCVMSLAAISRFLYRIRTSRVLSSVSETGHTSTCRKDTIRQGYSVLSGCSLEETCGEVNHKCSYLPNLENFWVQVGEIARVVTKASDVSPIAAVLCSTVVQWLQQQASDEVGCEGIIRLLEFLEKNVTLYVLLDVQGRTASSKVMCRGSFAISGVPITDCRGYHPCPETTSKEDSIRFIMLQCSLSARSSHEEQAGDVDRKVQVTDSNALRDVLVFDTLMIERATEVLKMHNVSLIVAKGKQCDVFYTSCSRRGIQVIDCVPESELKAIGEMSHAQPFSDRSEFLVSPSETHSLESKIGVCDHISTQSIASRPMTFLHGICAVKKGECDLRNPYVNAQQMILTNPTHGIGVQQRELVRRVLKMVLETVRSAGSFHLNLVNTGNSKGNIFDAISNYCVANMSNTQSVEATCWRLIHHSLQQVGQLFEANAKGFENQEKMESLEPLVHVESQMERFLLILEQVLRIDAVFQLP